MPQRRAKLGTVGLGETFLLLTDGIFDGLLAIAKLDSIRTARLPHCVHRCGRPADRADAISSETIPHLAHRHSKSGIPNYSMMCGISDQSSGS
jgi:hypothetical protein